METDQKNTIVAGVGILMDALNDHQPMNDFERLVLITLKFFSLNRFVIGVDLAELLNQTTANPVMYVIPANWRQAITQVQIHVGIVFHARYDIQCNDQLFSLLLTEGDGHINVSLRHKKQNNDGRIYVGALADRKIEELSAGTNHAMKFASFLQDFLFNTFKYPMECAFKNVEPTENCPHYVF